MQSKPPTWQSYVAEAFAWVLLALAWVVSYSTQVDLIKQHKFADWQAIIWPAGSDLASLCCMLLALDAAKRGLPNWEAWAWSGASAAVMIAANAIADWGDPLAVAAHAWLPILAVGVWHYLVIGRRPHGQVDALLQPVIEARPAMEPEAGEEALPEHEPSALPAPRQTRVSARKKGDNKGAKVRTLLEARLEALRESPAARAQAIKEVAAKARVGVQYVRTIAREVERASE